MRQSEANRKPSSTGYLGLAVLGLGLAWAVDLTDILVPATLVFMAFRAMAGVGLTLVMGISGQAVLGQAAFFGIGAYSALALTADRGWPMAATIVVAMAISAVVGGILGRLVFPLSGHFLAMATLAFGLIFLNLVQWAEPITGGNNGGTVPPIGIGSWRFGKDEFLGIDGDRFAFLVAWALVIGAVALLDGIVRSRSGRALIALRSSPMAAATSGIDTVRARTGAFMMSSAVAAFAGVLYAHFIGFVSPDAFSLLVSIELLILVTLGGLRSVWGAPLGAVALTLLVELTKFLAEHLVDGSSAPYEIMALGAAIVVVMLVAPGGIASIRWPLHRKAAVPNTRVAPARAAS